MNVKSDDMLVVRTCWSVLVVSLCLGVFAKEGEIRSIDYDVAVEMSDAVDKNAVATCKKKAAGISSVGRNDVLVFGDSLSDDCRTSNHWALVTGALNSLRTGSFRFYNYSMKGDVLRTVLERIDGKAPHAECFKDLWDRPYDWAMLMFGDLEMKAEECREIARRLKQRGVRRVVFLVPGLVAQKLCKSCEGVEFHDVYASLSPASLRAGRLSQDDARRAAESILDYLASTPNDRPVVLSSPAMTIGIPVDSSVAQRYAADELAKWAAKLMGGLVPKTVVGEGTVTLCASEEKGLVGEESFYLQETGGRLVITGGKRGLLYGVYELLERYGGITWVSSWRTVVPEKGCIAVPQGLNQRQSPAFLMRCGRFFDTVFADVDFAARCRYNGYRCKLEEKHGGAARVFGAGLEQHGIYALFPEKIYTPAAYPECWAKVPKELLRKGQHIQYCYSNPLVLQVTISNILQRIRKDPGALFYDCSQRDGWNYCRCEKCSAIAEEEKSATGPLLRFVNKVAEAVDKEFPGTRLSMFGYHWTTSPCAKTKLHKNVVPYYCTFEVDCSRPLEAVPSFENERAVSEMTGWSQQSDEMIIYTYLTDYYNYYHTIPNIRTFRPNFRFFRRIGARWVANTTSCSSGAHSHMTEYSNWMISKLLWDPSQPEGELTDRFLAGYYGAAAPYVKMYLRGLGAIERRNPQMMWIFEASDFGRVPESFLLEATELWNKAEEAVKGDQELEYNVRMGKLCVLFTRFMMLRGEHAPIAMRTDKFHEAEAHQLARWIQETLAMSRFEMAFAADKGRQKKISDLIAEYAKHE